jgi:hypothetical protein
MMMTRRHGWWCRPYCDEWSWGRVGRGISGVRAEAWERSLTRSCYSHWEGRIGVSCLAALPYTPIDYHDNLRTVQYNIYRTRVCQRVQTVRFCARALVRACVLAHIDSTESVCTSSLRTSKIWKSTRTAAQPKQWWWAGGGGEEAKRI